MFSGLDFFVISLLLWTGQWRRLARHYVRLDGEPRTDEEVIAMLKARVRPVREWPVEMRPVVGTLGAVESATVTRVEAAVGGEP